MKLLGYLYSTPGVGHVIAAGYALAGDNDEAAEALNAANRTTVVMVAGGLGSLTGPAGMAAGSYAAGALYDCGHTLYTGKAQGLVTKVDNILRCYENNDLSGGLESALDTSIYVGTDILTGWSVRGGGGGSKVGDLSKTTSKSLAKNQTTNVMRRNISTSVKAMQGLREVLLLRENDLLRPERVIRQLRGADGNASSSSEKSSSSTKSSKSSSSKSRNSHQTNDLHYEDEFTWNSGSEPPKDNKQDDKKAHEIEQNEPVSLFSLLYEIFLVENLNDICINGVYLFREINSKNKTDKARKDCLKTLIKKMVKNNCLEWALELVLSVMENRMHPSDVTFVNFLNLCELVTSYIIEKLASRHNEMQRSKEMPNDSRNPFKIRKEYYMERIPPDIICPRFLEVVSQEILGIASPYNLQTILNHLRLEIRQFNHISPGFVNEMSAMSHYFKHRTIPKTKIVLSVREYKDLILSLLDSVKNLKEYDDLLDGKRKKLCFDRVYSKFGGRRARLVLKKQNDKEVISSCHILEIAIPDEEDGYEEIDHDSKRFN